MSIGVAWADVWNEAIWGPVWAQTRNATTPDEFELGSVGGLELSAADVQSDLITVSGLGQSVSVTLSGDASAEYQKNGGVWATAPTTAVNGDTFRVRVDASAAYNATTFATLTIGDLSDTFTARTKTDPNAVVAGVLKRKISRLHLRR